MHAGQPHQLPIAVALARLRACGSPALTLEQATGLLGLPADDTHAVMSRLARTGAIVNLSTRLWAVVSPLDPYVLAPLMVAEDAYVSLESALHFHGWLRDAPSALHVVSGQGRVGTRHSRLGELRVLRSKRGLEGGFEEWRSPTGHIARVATPEKALLDLIIETGPSWFSPRHYRWGSPLRIRAAVISPWVARVQPPSTRSQVERCIQQMGGVTSRSAKPSGARTAPAASSYSKVRDAAYPADLEWGPLVDHARRIMVQAATAGEGMTFSSARGQLSDHYGERLAAKRAATILGEAARLEIIAAADMSSSLLGVPEAARLLGLAQSTVYMLIEQGEIPAVRVEEPAREPRRGPRSRSGGGTDPGAK